MSEQELLQQVVNISQRFAEKIKDIPRTPIKIVRVANGKVYKIIPANLIRVEPNSGNYNALVSVAGKNVELDIGSPPDFVSLKQAKDGGNFIYIDNQIEQEVRVKNY